MPTRPTPRLIEHLRRAALLRDGPGLGDGELLGRFIDGRDDAAVAVLVQRHGPMVWGVCRRLLSHHDAEDAFQATFLVLVKKAASVVPRAMVGSWLHGVAHQTALQARRTAARRRARERQVTEMPEPAVTGQDLWCDLRPLLDEELSRLPDRYRVAIVLCDLEGKTRREAAQQLGVPEGTVAGWLARARVMLARRLARHGLAVSGGMLAAVLSQEGAAAEVPISVASVTIQAASRSAAGQAVAGLVPAKVVTLTEGVLKTMSMTRFKMVFVLMVVAGVLGWGGGVAVWQTQAEARRGMPLVELPGAERMPDLGGTWQGDEWGTVVLRPTKDGGFAGTYTDTFGKDVGRIAVRWTPASRRCEGTWSEGRFRFGRIALEAAQDGEAISGAWTTDPRCEHQPGVPSLASLRWRRVEPEAGRKERLPRQRDRAGFTAWGRAIGGLQAGLGYRPGEKRTYHHGETVTLVLRLRNVSDAEVKFSYLHPFCEHAPTVTDGEGKPVPQRGVITELGERNPGEVRLAPGKGIELHELKRELRPASESDRAPFSALYGTGKICVQYERVLGHPSMGAPGWKLDPALSKLATGKLELDVKAAPPAPANELPVGWGGGGGTDYELRVDRTFSHGGQASATIKSVTTPPLWYGALTQAFNAERFRGQRLRMTAWVKSRDVENAAGLWMRVEGLDGKGNYSLSSDYMGDRPIKGTTRWQRYEVVLDVPREGAAQISFGVLLAGKGQVWVDDFAFEAVGTNVKTTGRAREAGKAQAGLAQGLPKAPRNLDFEQFRAEPEVHSDPPPAASGMKHADVLIEAGRQGMKVQAAGLRGIAPRVFHDAAKGILVLEGTADVPAILVRSRDGQNVEVRAAKIVYSLRAGTLEAESVSDIRAISQ
jgi:RNA polymerase sigma factor (sigma-70 family)